MKKEVPPFGVLAADYDPNTHVIVRSVTQSKSERRPDVHHKSKQLLTAVAVVANGHAQKELEMATNSNLETRSDLSSTLATILGAAKNQ